MDQFVLLLILAAISFLNWLFRKSIEYRQRRLRERATAVQEANVSFPQVQGEQSEANLRRLREALGLPDDAAPPSQPASIPSPPPAVSVPSPRAVKPVMRRRSPITKEPVHVLGATDHKKKLSVPPTRDAYAQVEDFQYPGKGIRKQLLQGEGIKNAVLLREVLGKPRALKPLEF